MKGSTMRMYFENAHFESGVTFIKNVFVIHCQIIAFIKKVFKGHF